MRREIELILGQEAQLRVAIFVFAAGAVPIIIKFGPNDQVVLDLVAAIATTVIAFITETRLISYGLNGRYIYAKLRPACQALVNNRPYAENFFGWELFRFAGPQRTNRNRLLFGLGSYALRLLLLLPSSIFIGAAIATHFHERVVEPTGSYLLFVAAMLLIFGTVALSGVGIWYANLRITAESDELTRTQSPAANAHP